MVPHRRTCSGGRRRAAFSLIELLVVITIVAVLASLLLPSLTLAKAMAVRVACGANARQLCAGFIAYASDTGGILPPPVTRSGGVYSGNPTWDLILAAFLDDGARPLLCPANKEALPTTANYNGVTVTARRSYAMPGDNISTTAQEAALLTWYMSSAVADADASGTMPLSRISGTSDCFLLVERWDLPGVDANQFAHTAGCMADDSSHQRGQHRGLDTYGFADGHVDALRIADTFGTGSAGRIVSKMKGAWTLTTGD